MNIKSISQTETDWNIPEELEKTFSKETLEDLLSTLNQVGGQRFYIMDYYRKRIIVESSSSLILCGHPKELANKKGFGFFKHILSVEEWHWLSCVNCQSYSIFFDTHLRNRKKSTILYDLTFINANKTEIILHHKVVPYQLCKNGNLWLSLCSVELSNQKNSPKALIHNTKTDEWHEFSNNRFHRIVNNNLSEDELLLLKCLTKKLHAEDICSLLGGITISCLKDKKRKMYQKMGVESGIEAVHWAHLRGIL
jgi:hypothetical protein